MSEVRGTESITVSFEADRVWHMETQCITGEQVRLVNHPESQSGEGGLSALVDRLELSENSFVMLDPAVEVLEPEVGEYRLLYHSYFETGMGVPPGEGLLTFVTALIGQPVRVAELCEEFDDQQLIRKMLTSLCEHGFAYVTSETKPSREELARLRELAAHYRNARLRHRIVIDLDELITIDQLRSQLRCSHTAPELLLRCMRLRDHKMLLEQLASLRQTREVNIHHTVVQTTDLTCDAEMRGSLVRLGAEVHFEGVSWPAPAHPIPGLAEMTRDCVPVHALMTPDLTILDREVRDRAIGWVKSNFLAGLRLQLESALLWPTANTTEEEFVDVFESVRELEDELGDVLISNLANDEVLLGNAAVTSRPAQLSDVQDRFRKTYSRWRIPLLKSYEGENTWSQIPEAEDKLLPPSEDLLPNHPELLLLRPRTRVLDVCGGAGRVARRLAPLVGQDGLIISIEMLRCLSERARHFARERNTMNIQFRTGLEQRIPLSDGSMDAAVNEWTGAIWELGLGSVMVKEMVRVVRPGGRIAVTHRLVQIPLAQLGQPWVQYEEIYHWMRVAFEDPLLKIVTERVWGQIVRSLVGENARQWRKQYMPRLLNPDDMTYECDEIPGLKADVYLTIVAERL